MMAGILSVGVQKDGGSYPTRTLYLHHLNIDSLSSEGSLDKKAPSLGKLQFGYWEPAGFASLEQCTVTWVLE